MVIEDAVFIEKLGGGEGGVLNLTLYPRSISTVRFSCSFYPYVAKNKNVT